jgi:tetratricopeptide (TPR) repeat protein
MNIAPNVKRTLRTLGVIAAGLLCTGSFTRLHAEETNPPAAANPQTPDAASTEALRSYLHLQEQLHATQLALERNRQEAETLAARNAEAVSARLQFIEQAMTSQRGRELEAMQSTNRLLLIMAGSFAGVGFLAMLLTAYLQWRAVNRLAEFTAVLTGAGRTALPAPARTDLPLVSTGATEQANARLFGALTRLEERIHELEHDAQIPLPDKSAPASSTATNPSPAQIPKADTNGEESNQSHVALLLAKGQSLLSLDKASEALACYDEILALEPNHPEALVKKGATLEQIRQYDDALTCYDRAIAADGSLTIAYLQKGGLFNRLERYEEALQCYELALRTQEKSREN